MGLSMFSLYLADIDIGIRFDSFRCASDIGSAARAAASFPKLTWTEIIQRIQ